MPVTHQIPKMMEGSTKSATKATGIPIPTQKAMTPRAIIDPSLMARDLLSPAWLVMVMTLRGMTGRTQGVRLRMNPPKAAARAMTAMPAAESIGGSTKRPRNWRSWLSGWDAVVAAMSPHASVLEKTVGSKLSKSGFGVMAWAVWTTEMVRVWVSGVGGKQVVSLHAW